MQIRDVVFDELRLMAERSKDIYLIIADIGSQGVEKFKTEFPEQFFDVGIAEQNAINIATGLALAKKRPFVFGIASFITQRCYEQLHLAALMELPLIIISIGYGRGYWWDGATHWADHDDEIMKLAGYIVATPETPEEATMNLQHAYEIKKPYYLRMKKE